ncbi:hypothetical protein HPB48_014553 [Haemaphysalis longicornis]|uniref:Nlr family card domain protein n=1 Tax=Haemaphysalis longicornis TaxID=44386 RepID=A0A9J6GKM6_HAELO|nr:hypothetical protein HPB48_014553 [Haemaphysalis longicornis]
MEARTVVRWHCHGVVTLLGSCTTLCPPWNEGSGGSVVVTVASKVMPASVSYNCTDSEGPTEDLSTMESLNGQFFGQTLDFRLLCTATEDTPCQIVDHLSAWNEFFCLASWQLKEVPGTSGKLSLAFFRDANREYCSSQQLDLVTLLACELLKGHRCVSNVEFDIHLFAAHLKTLSDALRASSSITSVKLVFSSRIPRKDIVPAALSLPHLRELEFSGYAKHSRTLVSRLSTFLQTTKSLTALRVSIEWCRGLSWEDFFQGLRQNCSLQELVLPIRFITETSLSAQAAFTEWLTKTVSLKSLTVASRCEKYVQPLKCILRALLANRSVVAVVFDCPYIYQSDVEFVSKVFEENKVLRSFKMLYTCGRFSAMPSFVQGGLDKVDCDRCLKALIENHTLEKVCLPFDVWNECQWKELFEALPAKRNLKQVSIEAMGRAPSFFVGKLCAALKETGADEKVCFNVCFYERDFDERCACKAFSTLAVSANDGNRAAVFEILERMLSLGHITCLYLYFDFRILLDGVLSSVLATFLGATRTLKTLVLRASWDMALYDCQEGLLDGLARNTSLREVVIEVKAWEGFSKFYGPLADVVIASKNISRVSGEVAFFQSLSRGIADNYTLLSVAVPGCANGKFEKYWFKVLDTTRRNCGLLTDAADFARNARRDRRCALALDRMHGHPELVKEVAWLERVGQAQAAAMVRDGLRSTEGLHDFMRLAGVVQERVSCHVREDGRTQLDALNEHCWRAVRRYLKLWDVKKPNTRVS